MQLHFLPLYRNQNIPETRAESCAGKVTKDGAAVLKSVQMATTDENTEHWNQHWHVKNTLKR